MTLYCGCLNCHLCCDTLSAEKVRLWPSGAESCWWGEKCSVPALPDVSGLFGLESFQEKRPPSLLNRTGPPWSLAVTVIEKDGNVCSQKVGWICWGLGSLKLPYDFPSKFLSVNSEESL